MAARARLRAEIVALTVDPDDFELEAIVRATEPDYLQLHGRETPERVAEVQRKFGVSAIKAIGVAEAADFALADAYRDAADALLIDAKPPDRRDAAGRQRRRIRLAARARVPPSQSPGCFRAASTPTTWATLSARAARGRSTCPRASRARRASRTAPRSTPSSRRPRGVRGDGSGVIAGGDCGAKGTPKGRAFDAEGALRRCDANARKEPALTKIDKPNSFRNGPDERGHFGIFGGRFVAETLMPLILSLEKAYEAAKIDPAFHKELAHFATHYVGRPSPLYFAERMTERLGGAKIYFKRDELNHTGAHKINNVMGQILLARRMGKERIIAETGAGQHGVATATACARFGLKCVVYMGAVDVERQKPNVFRMKMLGAEVIPVQSGARTLKDAMNEALRDWVTNVADTFYCIGTAAGPHPYPAMVRDFQSVIGTETREQMMAAEGRLPDSLVACIGGGSNAIGLFHPFLDDEGIEIFGVEAAGHGLEVPDGHAASLAGGRPGVLHGNRTYLLMNEDGQINEGHSISAGLDYPGIGPEHAWLRDSGRVTYLSATDKEALDAFQLCSRLEGIIPALEPAHALAKVIELAPKRPHDHLMVMNLCGRGDKDIFAVADHLGGM